MGAPWWHEYRDHEPSVHIYTSINMCTVCSAETSDLFSQVTDLCVTGFCVYQELEEI